MTELIYDQELSIITTGIREWRDGSTEYNRCEPTPYEALNRLFTEYKFSKNDSLVDFGCGRGRVAFYIHNTFKIPVKGIEVNDVTFDEALNNKETYCAKFPQIEAPIQFEFGMAENYEIEPTNNKFYFFNPFSVDIFKKVINNIINSARENPRGIDLIIYYPIAEYQSYLKKSTPFTLIDKIYVPDAIDPKEKFFIYRYGV